MSSLSPDPKHILVRMPNWLGDMVMAAWFIRDLQVQFPNAELHLIVKTPLRELARLFPGHTNLIFFNKNQWPGLIGSLRFARWALRSIPYDYFFCLPNSFSSAWMGYYSSARIRIGYKNEFRNFLLSHSLKKPAGLHRVDDYRYLLHRWFPERGEHLPTTTPPATLSPGSLPALGGQPALGGLPAPGAHTTQEEHLAQVILQHPHPRNPIHLMENGITIVLNINSQAPSRRLTLEGWQRIIMELRRRLKESLTEDFSRVRFYLPGSQSEESRVRQLIDMAGDDNDLIDCCGRTDLLQLADLMKRARLVISSDSGPAHLANAYHTPTIVLFGAGNEKSTAPYCPDSLRIIKNDSLKCRPCVKNHCPLKANHCLESLSPEFIADTAIELLNLIPHQTNINSGD